MMRGSVQLVARSFSQLSTACTITHPSSPKLIARAPVQHAKTLYVVGGMYGNPQALNAIEAMLEEEDSEVAVVFNGDFNFFNAKVEELDGLNRRIFQSYSATAGNIEVSIASEARGSDGCGCDYPSYVSRDVVARSDAIVKQLGQEAGGMDPELLFWLRGLRPFTNFCIGGARVAIMHGDPHSLSGWSLAVENLETSPEEFRRRHGSQKFPTTTLRDAYDWMRAANADMFACTHTCLPFAQRIHHGPARSFKAIFNNGSAGMANFSGESFGVACLKTVGQVSRGQWLVRTAFLCDSITGSSLTGEGEDRLMSLS
eukprot:292849-Hanusia_phi.AAC.2